MRKTTYSLAAILVIALLLGVYFLITKGLKAETTAVMANSTEVMRYATEAVQSQLQAEIANLKGRLTDSEQARDKMAKMLEDKVKDMTSATNALSDEIANGKKREIELEAQKASLEARVGKLTVELNETQTQFTTLKENPVNEPHPNTKLLKRELLMQEKKLTRITDLYNRLKDELKDFAEVINKKDDALAAKNTEIESLKARINELEKNRVMLMEENDPQKARAAELKKRVEVILQAPK
jgi:chromosome segregation ATPase